MYKHSGCWGGGGGQGGRGAQDGRSPVVQGRFHDAALALHGLEAVVPQGAAIRRGGVGDVRLHAVDGQQVLRGEDVGAKAGAVLEMGRGGGGAGRRESRGRSPGTLCIGVEGWVSAYETAPPLKRKATRSHVIPIRYVRGPLQQIRGNARWGVRKAAGLGGETRGTTGPPRTAQAQTPRSTTGAEQLRGPIPHGRQSGVVSKEWQKGGGRVRAGAGRHT